MNNLDQTVQEIDDRLQRLHLAGVVEDEEARLSLEVELGRLVLYGSIAVAGGAMTAAWGGTRDACVPALRSGLLLLSAAISFAFFSLQVATILRSWRVSRKHQSLTEARHQVFEGKGPTGFTYEWKRELSTGRIQRLAIILGFVLAAVGSATIIDGAVAAIAHRDCWYFTVWPLTYLN